MIVKRLLFCFLFILVTFSRVIADDYDLPDEVSFLADDIVSMITSSVPHSQKAPVLVAVRGVEMNDTVPPFGEKLAMTVSTRLANTQEPGLLVRAHLPVDSYLSEFSSTGYGAESEDGFDLAPDFVLIGEAFEADGTLHLLLQLINVGNETIMSGLEASLVIDQWLHALMRIDGPDTASEYIESDRFEPDSPDNALVLSADEVVEERTIGPAGDRDWFVVEAEGMDGKALVSLFTTGETDTYMEVYGPDEPDVLFAENDDGDDANASVGVLMEGGQRVWVVIRGYDETTIGHYTFHAEISPFEGDPLEPDNSMEDANALNLGYEGGTDSFLMPGTDEDWYYVDILQQPRPNTILSIETIGDLDTYMDLYSESGMEMLSNDDGGEGDNARIDLFLESTGRFFVRVKHYDGSDQGEYRIVADYSSATPDEFEPDDGRTQAKEIRADGSEQQKNFTPADDQDWIKFTISETGTVTVRTFGDIDTYVKLFDRLGNLVAEDDDSGSDYNAQVERLLQPGQYFVRIHQVEGDAVFGGEYGVSVRKR